MPQVELQHGTVHYHDSGSGAPIVFLHGYLMGANLWDPVVSRLDGEFRCVRPELPLGAHPAPLRPGADLTAAGLGRLVADFLDALDLRDVTLVGNDSGGAIAQVVAARHPGRLGRLVLASCDVFEFPPEAFRPLIDAARAGKLTPLFANLERREVRALPNAYGGLTHGELPHDQIDQWVAAYFADEGVQRDTHRLTAALGDHAFMRQIADELAGFTKPALLAWAAEDQFFPVDLAQRLAAILPDARVELIPGSRTWVMRDQPERTAQLIGDFARRAAVVQPG